MATRNREPLYVRIENALFATTRVIGQGLLLVLFIGLLWVYTWIADALINAPEPTERCFAAGTTESGYCRMQHRWE